jgi:ADP-ribosylglycohydrolase
MPLAPLASFRSGGDFNQSRTWWEAVHSVSSLASGPTTRRALWCFLQTETFESAILRAANLGDDADTTAAVCGQLAGAFYGARGIRVEWLERLVMRREITGLAERLYSSRRVAV